MIFNLIQIAFRKPFGNILVIGGLNHYRKYMADTSILQKEVANSMLQKVQPALLGLMDGSVSTLAPIFAAAGLTGQHLKAFYGGLAASPGASISMAWQKHYQTTAL